MGIIRVRTSGLGEVPTMAERKQLLEGLFATLTKAADSFKTYYYATQDNPALQRTLNFEYTRLKSLVTQTAEQAQEVMDNPSPLAYESAFLSVWKRGDCYVKAYARGEAPPEIVDTPPTPTEGAQVEAEPSEDVIVVEDGAVTDGSALGKVPWWAWLVLGYAGYRVYKRK